MGRRTFRVFTTSTGQAFSGKLISYVGQTFYLKGKDNKLYPVQFKQLSANDQKYLIKVAQSGTVPKGDPRSLPKEGNPGDRVLAFPVKRFMTPAKMSDPVK
jgi:hypothetical protein